MKTYQMSLISAGSILMDSTFKSDYPSFLWVPRRDIILISSSVTLGAGGVRRPHPADAEQACGPFTITAIVFVQLSLSQGLCHNSQDYYFFKGYKLN